MVEASKCVFYGSLITSFFKVSFIYYVSTKLNLTSKFLHKLFFSSKQKSFFFNITFWRNFHAEFNFQTPIDITSLSSPTSASGQSSNNLVPNVMRNQNTKYSRLATTGKCFTNLTKTVVNLTTYGWKPGDYKTMALLFFNLTSWKTRPDSI